MCEGQCWGPQLAAATEGRAAVMAQPRQCPALGGHWEPRIHCLLEEGKLFPSKADDRPLLGFFQRKTLHC